MATILVTTLPHESHINPLFAITRELERRGHEIHYLGHPAINRRIREEGFHYLNRRTFGPGEALLLWRKGRLEKTRGLEELRQVLILFTTHLAGQTRDLLRIIDRIKPDLLLNHVFYYPGGLAAERSRIPWVDCWSAGLLRPLPGDAPGNRTQGVSSLLDAAELRKIGLLFDQRLNRARRRLGLSSQPPGALLRPSRWLQLFLTTHELEFLEEDLGPTAVFVGPSFMGRNEEAAQKDFPWNWVLEGPPVVYVSLGNFFNRRPDFFHRIIEAFDGEHLRVVVGTPLAGSKRFRRLPSNIRFFPQVPQVSLLPKVSVFIFHGGNNSMNEAMAAGIPMLITPIGAEQIYNAERACRLGAGLSADVDHTGPDELRRMTIRILRDDSFKTSADRLRRILSRCDAPRVSSDLIQKILEGGQPVHRPVGENPTRYADSPPPDRTSSFPGSSPGSG